MKIIMLLSNAFRPDPRVLKEAQSLAKDGNEITIFCWDRLNEFQAQEKISNGLDVIRVQNIKSYYGRGIGQIYPLLRFWWFAVIFIGKCKPNIIHCHDFDTLIPGLIMGKIHHVPIVYDAHEYYADLVSPRLRGIIGKILYHFIRFMEKTAAGISNAVVTVDEVLASIYRKSNHNVLVIGHYPQLNFVVTTNEIFKRPELKLLYAGRISSDRGALLYIELLRILINRGIPARLLYAGVYTPTNEELKVHNRLLGLEDYFKYLGWVPYQQMTEVYNSADIGLAILMPEPRYVAALPVKLFEYMANGLPIIASNFPAIVSIIDETRCGLYVDPQSNPSDTANIIENWWKNPTIPQTFGGNGRNAILSKYNWDNQIGKLSVLYRTLVNKYI